MYQGLYTYANENRVMGDIFQGNASWQKGSKTFARDIKARSATPIDTSTKTINPHYGEVVYQGFYSFAKENFSKRDLVLEYFEAHPSRPLPGWVKSLSRGPRSFQKFPEAKKPPVLVSV